MALSGPSPTPRTLTLLLLLYFSQPQPVHHIGDGNNRKEEPKQAEKVGETLFCLLFAMRLCAFNWEVPDWTEWGRPALSFSLLSAIFLPCNNSHCYHGQPQGSGTCRHAGAFAISYDGERAEVETLKASDP